MLRNLKTNKKFKINIIKIYKKKKLPKKKVKHKK